MSLVIEGGTIVAADRTYKADVLVEGETIKAIGEGLKGDSTLDAKGCFILPGGIDPHTHLDMPFMGANSADNYESGTKAALSGGTTMVVDFCIPNRNQPLMEAFADWDKRAKDAVADYSYHMCITYWDDSVREDMAKVVAAGVTTFKHFMAYKGALMVNDEEMFASFARCAELGAMPLVHAENGEVVAALQKHYLAKGVTGPEGHALSRPPDVEGEAANRAIMLADQAGVPLYVVHTSCIQAHEAIRRARALGKRVYGEPLIQHLVLDESEYYDKDWKHAARRVMSPPFRDKVHQDDLWNGLRAGSLQVVATDHCAFTTKQKELGLSDFTKIPNGTGGLEDRMPVLVDLWRRDRAADDERVRRRDLDQHRPHSQSLSAQGRDPARRRRRHHRLGSQGQQDHLGPNPGFGHRLQRVRGHEGDRAAALHAVARRGRLSRRHGAGRARARPLRQARAVRRGRARAQALQGVHRGGGRCALRERIGDGRSGGSQTQAGRRRQGAGRGRRDRDRGVSLRFETADGPVQALSDVNLKVARGEFVSFIGPSGCGKTTLLRAVADLETPTSGAIRVNGMSPQRGARQARLWLRVPGAGALSVAQRRPQHRAAARNHGLRQGRARGAGRQGTRARQSLRLRQQISLAIVGRHAAARVDRARAVVRPRSPARWTSRSARSTRSCATC